MCTAKFKRVRRICLPATKKNMYKHVNFLLVYLLHVVSSICPKAKKNDQKEETIVLINPKPNLSTRTNLAKALE